MWDDQWTRQQAQIIAKDYGLIPYDPLKCERYIGGLETSSIFFANTSNRVKCYVQYDSWAVSVSGWLSPDAAGTYSLIDLHNGKNYYRRTDEAWFLWWDNVDTWNLSISLGVQGAHYWTRTDPDIDGDYVKQGTAEGDAAVEPPNF